MAKALSPNNRSFWNRPVEEVGENLVGERVEAVPSQTIVIARIQMFRGLPRDAMNEVFGNKTRRPGDIFIAPHRGSPLINITTKISAGQPPEVIWLREFLQSNAQDPEKILTVPGAQIARAIAELHGRRNLSKEDLLEFCLEELDGQNVQNPLSPFRIIPNVELPVDEREVEVYDNEKNAKNCVGERGF